MSAIVDHLWQSTWFAVAAWLLALLVRKDRARVRYWVWFAASIKFLIPFAALEWIGNHFILQLQDRPTLLPIVQQVSAPITGGTISIEPFGEAMKYALVIVWALGSAALLGRWIVEWLRARNLVATSSPCAVAAPVPVRSSNGLATPAVIGLYDPVILLPRYVLATSTRSEIDAIVAHELWHARRRDNLAAAVHTLTQILFWFHPFVWWIGERLTHEREYACDEGVLEEGHDPSSYAHTLLRVCKHSLATRLLCAASVAGGDVTARVRAIVLHRIPPRAVVLRRVVLAVALALCLALPVASGMMVIATSELRVAAGASSIEPSGGEDPTFTVVQDDYVYARNVSLRELVSEVYSVHPREVRSHSRALDYPRYDIELRAAKEGSGDPRLLVAELLKRQFNLELVVRSAGGL